MVKLIDNPNYEIIDLWATKDKRGNFLDISHVKDDVYKWFETDPEATSITNGFGIVDMGTGFLVEYTNDFYYTFKEVLEEMNKEF